MKTRTGKTGRRWFDPIIRVERNAAHFLSDDFEHTVEDMNALDRKVKRAGRRHPFAFISVETVLFVLVLVTLLTAQLNHASRFGP